MSQVKQQVSAKSTNRTEGKQSALMQQWPESLLSWSQRQLVMRSSMNHQHLLNSVQFAQLQRSIGNQILQLSPKGAVPKEAITSDKLSKLGTKEQTEFMRKVYDAQLRKSAATKEFYIGLSDEQLETVEGKFQLRKDAADACRSLLAQARTDLQQQKTMSDKKALRVKSIGLSSAYRSLTYDFDKWQEAFKTAYQETSMQRNKLADGAYGKQAIQLLARDMMNRKATPGYSNHTKGLSVDFATFEGKSRLTAKKAQNSLWAKSWLYEWLVANAGKFRFEQLPSELFHWDYKGEGSEPSSNIDNHTGSVLLNGNQTSTSAIVFKNRSIQTQFKRSSLLQVKGGATDELIHELARLEIEREQLKQQKRWWDSLNDPELKRYDQAIEKLKSRIAERGNSDLKNAPITLIFDGAFLRIQGERQAYFEAVSGKPNRFGKFNYSQGRQRLENIGPIPEGVYWIDPTQLGIVKRPWEWAGFGLKRLTIHPFHTTHTFGRGGFFIHGGVLAGSGGCIDLTSAMADFSEIVSQYQGYKIILYVKYPKMGDFPLRNQTRNGQVLRAKSKLYAMFERGQEKQSETFVMIQRQSDLNLNNPQNLRMAVSIEELFDLYANKLTNGIHTIGPKVLLSPPTYSDQWVQGAGQASVEVEIRHRLELKRKQKRQDHLGWFIKYIDTRMPLGDITRKLWLREAVESSIRRIGEPEFGVFADANVGGMSSRVARERSKWGKLDQVVVNNVAVDVYGAKPEQLALISSTLSALHPLHLRQIPRIVVGDRVGPIGSGKITQGGNSARRSNPLLSRLEVTNYALAHKIKKIGSVLICFTLLHEVGHWVDWGLRIYPRNQRTRQTLEEWFQTLDYSGETQGSGERSAEAYWRYYTGELPSGIRQILESSPAWQILQSPTNLSK